ncbi:MAG: carboxymuconolactone decarboxylase family protein [Dehalococcoidia bacterium]
MPRFSSVQPDSVPTDLAELAPDPFYGILARRPEILRAWNALDVVLFGPSSALDNHLKEEARRTLAQGAGCRYCASLGEPKPDHQDPREAMAVAFAELVATDHHQVDDNTFAALREVFTDEEIIELMAWVCFKLGSNIFGSMLKLAPATPEQVDGYARFVADGAALPA